MVLSYLPSSILACLDGSKTNPKIGFIDHPFDASELHQTKQAQRSYSTLKTLHPPKTTLGGGFKYFLFSPLFGEDFQFD